jgi:hypothetical protein
MISMGKGGDKYCHFIHLPLSPLQLAAEGAVKDQKNKNPQAMRLQRRPGGFSMLAGETDQGSFNVNQVEIPFMPLRSTLAPSHTANANGTDIPGLN